MLKKVFLRGNPGQSPVGDDNAGSRFLEVDQAVVRDSYTTNSLARIQTVLRAIKQTQTSVERVRTSIEAKLSQSKEQENKKCELELLCIRVAQTRNELQDRTKKLQREKETFESSQAQSHQRDVYLRSKFETLEKDKNRLHDKKKGYFDVREDLIKTGAQLVMRRKQLISELALIYPIVEHQNGALSICNVRLPNSEDFSGQDEIMIAVALGYTCHLVDLISQFLDVPLRYPMEHRVSRSKVKDHILDKLTDKDRDFPLYSKGKERFQFNYGVYLLNKNIAQLRYYCGLGTTDLRLTLPNLKTLLELRLGVKFETGTLSVIATQHMQIPPNLGGPQKLTSGLSKPMPTREEAVVINQNRNESNSHTSRIVSDSSGSEDEAKFEQILHETREDMQVRELRGESFISRQDDKMEQKNVQTESELFPGQEEHYSNLQRTTKEIMRKPVLTDPLTSGLCDTENDASVLGTNIVTSPGNDKQAVKDGNNAGHDEQGSSDKGTRDSSHRLILEKAKVGEGDAISTCSTEDDLNEIYGARFNTKLWPKEQLLHVDSDNENVNSDNEQSSHPEKVLCQYSHDSSADCDSGSLHGLLDSSISLDSRSGEGIQRVRYGEDEVESAIGGAANSVSTSDMKCTDIEERTLALTANFSTFKLKPGRTSPTEEED